MASASRPLAAQDDEYFPSFLTAFQSTPKADKSKESAPRTRSEADILYSKGKPRLTFAESLSMTRKKQQGVEIPDDSPFSYDGNYQDGLGTRRRKNVSSSAAEGQDEDVPPPPTMSLLDPVGFAAGSHSVDDDEAAAAAAARRTAMAARVSNYPNIHSDEWGQDKQYWVTVFGFPSSAKSFILHQFQSVGEVVNYSSSSGGNWLQLRYHTRLQAEKALSYDGRTLANNIMIGVKKCYPSDRDANALDETPVSSYFGAQARQSLGSRNLEVDPIDTDIMLPPRRRQDICSRLLSYLFNW
ncbi:uncharacterized protein PITG_12683 [Phytophthora infestans T30-4]|uniref:RRM Nup35-type domain-containing protein n=2 Tax=Phytophthora infestans TaxID=4787 RepID=D0NKY2_PHYIT|nr:uncharacterized protein PITG_12683 [Phytophthora infestans T30-4]EEY60300.1 conserved hypothetical protein [Phytophthora infestans T30-4]KAF4037216.1 Nup53/35/40-type RNA recognition motif-containing protein [Phytophthora infestans]KAF4146356.1 Nup53/35/40-type RNA recognition motif [Phytophthora infestans]KAI9983893.1 hypothetical protein PInf_005169 [Phytophthora infestans]|eukprot:XP_002900096.1 conserved hypothetical protein [Phytophthora infestans T30-4]